MVARLMRTATERARRMWRRDPLDRLWRYAFWHEGVAHTTRQICRAIRLAGRPVTAETVAAFAETMPFDARDTAKGPWRDGTCGVVMKEAHDNSVARGRPEEFYAVAREIYTHFCDRDRDAKFMLVGAVRGVLAEFARADQREQSG